MILGLTGYANSGKDTVAEILVKGHGFKRYAFADKLRELAYAINPIIGEPYGQGAYLQELVDAEGWDAAKRHIPQVRELLQNLGVWHRDNISEDFWVHQVFMQWDADDYRPAVITDVRFPNEARFIRDNFGSLWRVNRPGVGPVNGHISEQLDLAADATIWNGSTVAHLMLKVHELVREEQAA